MIDQIARSSAAELRTGTTGDVEAGLADLHVRHARHRRRAMIGAAAALVVTLGAGWSAGVVMTRDGAEDQHGPAGRHESPTPGPNVPTDVPGVDVCTESRVTCLGDRTYSFDLDRPVVWAIPPYFEANSGLGTTPVTVESYRQVGPTAGVTVLEHVRASRPDGSGPADVADTPRAFVDWVADRPFLDAGKVTRTTLDGRQAWRVQVRLTPGAGDGASRCSGHYVCHAITYQARDASTGIWSDMVAQYIAFRLPGAGTTVVWSWEFGTQVEHLGTLEEAVHALSFPAS
jgi:hypothetical protein